jgi:hypothetical protein
MIIQVFCQFDGEGGNFGRYFWWPKNQLVPKLSGSFAFISDMTILHDFCCPVYNPTSKPLKSKQ